MKHWWMGNKLEGRRVLEHLALFEVFRIRSIGALPLRNFVDAEVCFCN